MTVATQEEPVQVQHQPSKSQYRLQLISIKDQEKN